MMGGELMRRDVFQSGVTDMEEKVQYQSEERLRDIQEQIASLETRISTMEHQSAQHQQVEMRE